MHPTGIVPATVYTIHERLLEMYILSPELCEKFTKPILIDYASFKIYPGIDGVITCCTRENNK